MEFGLADEHARRRRLIVLLSWALLIASLDLARLLTVRDHSSPRPSAAPSETRTPAVVQAPATTPPEVSPPATPPNNSTRVGFSAQRPTQQSGTTAPAVGPAVEPAIPPTPPEVSCGT